MAQQIINIGAAPDDDTGDPIRTAFDKSNQNFTELYNLTSTTYDNTVFVDPNGSASSDGKNPARPTTFANAIANLAFSTNLVLSEGTYTTGGPIALTQSNVTFSAIQGGTGSNSTIITDDITIGAGITRTRWHGVRFDGAFLDNGSDGRHYFSWCSLGGSASFTRTNPNRWCLLTNCDFSSGTFSIGGAGANGATTTLTGTDSVTGVKTLSATDHIMFIHSNATSGGATITNGALSLEECDVVGGASAINASAGTKVLLSNSKIISPSDAPQTVTLAGEYNYQNTIFDISNSTLSGTPIKTETSYWTGPIQAQNIYDRWEFGLAGNWTEGNYLISNMAAGHHARMVADASEVYMIEITNDIVLTATTVLELVKNPYGGSPTVVATIPMLNSVSAVISSFPDFTLAQFDFIGVRVKAGSTESPVNPVVHIRARILD